MTTGSIDLRARACDLCGSTRCAICTETACGLRYCQHHTCEVCGFALEHRRKHPDGRTTDQEWEGRANSARAGKAAGRPLTPVEVKALEMYPDPARLTIDGYRRSDGTKPAWATDATPAPPAPTQPPLRGDERRPRELPTGGGR